TATTDIYTLSLHDALPIFLDVVDNEPIVNDTQLQMWDWIAEYYMCYVGDVMQAALPAALKMASETKIVASDDPNLDRSSLSDKRSEEHTSELQSRENLVCR